MEIPRKHDKKKKKNSKTLPAVINIGAGAGSFGIGGIVLFGGALVTATIVSVLAFKTKRQRPPPSPSSPSPAPEIKTAVADAAPNQPEFMMKSNEDSQNQSDGVNSMREMQMKSNQYLTSEEKRNGMDDDGEKVDYGHGEDQESYVDSVFESEEVDSEKTVMQCEEQVVLVVRDENDQRIGEKLASNEVIEKEKDGAFLEADVAYVSEEVDGPQVQFLEEEKEKDKDCDDEMIMEKDGEDQESYVDSDVESEEIDNEKIGMECEEQVVVSVRDENDKVVSNEDVTTIEENEVIEGVSEDQVEESLQCEKEKDEMLLEDDVAYVLDKEDDDEAIDSIEVEDGTQMRFLEEEKEKQQMQNNSEKKVMVEEEAIKAVCLESVNADNVLEVADHEVTVAQVAQEMQLMSEEENCKETEHKIEEEEEEEEVKEKESESEIAQAEVGDQPVERENNPLIQLTSKEEEIKVEVQVNMIIEDKSVTEEETPLVQAIEKVEESKEIISEDELVMNEEIPLLQTTEEVVEESKDVKQEANISYQKTEENIEEDDTNNKNHNGSVKEDEGNKSDRASSYLFHLRVWTSTLSALVSIWCLCHWYSQLPFPQLSFIGSLFFIFILFAYRNRTTYLVKYK